MVPVVGVTEKFSAARQKVMVALLLRADSVDVDVAGEVRGVGCGAEAGDFGVEADGDVEVVVAGEKEEGVALGAELVVLLDGVDAIDLGLHGRCGRGGREDGDVGAEVGGLGERWGLRGRPERRAGQRGRGRIAWGIRICLGTSACLVRMV